MAKLNENASVAGDALPTTTTKAIVTLTVVPKAGQSIDAAAAEMLELFTEYLTSSDGVFQTDYGSTREKIALWQSGGSSTDPTWGGYEGPFVLSATVTAG